MVLAESLREHIYVYPVSYFVFMSLSFSYLSSPSIADLSTLTCFQRPSAEEAIQRMQGAIIGQQAVRVSWGRSPTAKLVQIPPLVAHVTCLCPECSRLSCF